MKTKAGIIVITVALLILNGCSIRVNSSIRIRNGEKVDRSLRTVNGGIYIGSDCEVNGSAKTVNGKIVVGSNSKVGTLETVNGRIDLGDEVMVEGDAKTINGSISALGGTEIEGNIRTINGSIKLTGTTVGKGLYTHNGNIYLKEGCTIVGDIVIRRSNGINVRIRKMKIEISGGSVVEGDIQVKDRDIQATVYIAPDSKIKGSISGAKVVEGENKTG